MQSQGLRLEKQVFFPAEKRHLSSCLGTCVLHTCYLADYSPAAKLPRLDLISHCSSVDTLFLFLYQLHPSHQLPAAIFVVCKSSRMPMASRQWVTVSSDRTFVTNQGLLLKVSEKTPVLPSSHPYMSPELYQVQPSNVTDHRVREPGAKGWQMKCE